MIRLRQIGADDWQEWRALRLKAQGGDPGAFGSKLADWQGDGDAEERWRSRLESVPFNVLADRGGTRSAICNHRLSRESADLLPVLGPWVTGFNLPLRYLYACREPLSYWHRISSPASTAKHYWVHLEV